MWDSKQNQLDAIWREVWGNTIAAVHAAIGPDRKYPNQKKVLRCTKENPLSWDVYKAFWESSNQCQESFQEQKFIIGIRKSHVDKYIFIFGRAISTFTKNIIIHGVPGSGKTHLAQLILLYAMAKGLKVMLTSLMAARATQLGGIHYHKFGFHTKTNVTPYRLAELALENYAEKANCRICI